MGGAVCIVLFTSLSLSELIFFIVGIITFIFAAACPWLGYKPRYISGNVSGLGYSLGLQNSHHFVSSGIFCVQLEVAGHGKDGVAHAYLGYAVRAASCAGFAGLFCHRLSFQFVRVDVADQNCKMQI